MAAFPIITPILLNWILLKIYVPWFCGNAATLEWLLTVMEIESERSMKRVVCYTAIVF